MKATVIQRKIAHLTVGVFLIIAIIIGQQYLTHQEILLSGFILLLILIVVDILRIDYNIVHPLYKKLLKETEHTRFNALIYAVAAAIIILAIAPFPIALTALLITVVGDAIASLLGVTFGGPATPYTKNKTVIGTTTMLITSTIIGVIILGATYTQTTATILAIAMAITATLAENYTNVAEDNFIIPIVTTAIALAILVL